MALVALVKARRIPIVIALIAVVGLSGVAAATSWIPGVSLGATWHRGIAVGSGSSPTGHAGRATAMTVPLAPPTTDRVAEIRAKKAQTQAMQAEVQNQLDLALSSEARVQAEVDRLTAAVASQHKVLENARSAEVTANADATAATRWLTDATRKLDQAKGELKAWALRAYMRSDNLFGASRLNIDELARGQALLDVAFGNRNDVIDVFRQDKQDQLQATTGVRAALAVAQARTRTAADAAANLREAQQAQEAASAALQTRISALQGESAALAAQEKGIEALIAGEGAAVKLTLAKLVPTRPAGGAGLIWPVHGPVTSEFGPRWGGFHPGIDIAAPYGTAIQAAQDGVVIFAGWNGGYGNFVLIDHGGGIVTGYAHQSRIAVSRGQVVHQGDVIGYEGSTGYSTGPHVHFEVRVNGSPQNPRNYEVGSP